MFPESIAADIDYEDAHVDHRLLVYRPLEMAAKLADAPSPDCRSQALPSS